LKLQEAMGFDIKLAAVVRIVVGKLTDGLSWCAEDNVVKRFSRKRVMITGAGSGLGRALSVEFARLGWRVCIVDIDRARAEQTAQLVGQGGGVPLVRLCDVTDTTHLTSLADVLDREWGGVDVVVNNAGTAAAGHMEKIALDDWERIMAVNLKGVIYGCRAFIPMLVRQGGGHIVNVASAAGIVSLPEMSCYNVTKAGVISLSESLRVELADKNIGVTVAVPSFFKSNLLDRFTCTDPRQRELTDLFFDRALASAEEVARDLLRAVARNRLYVMTQRDGRVLWFIKRMAPEFYFKLLVWIYRKSRRDKFPGVDKV
jgi:NAD(P)-dependent dehydrogenase (short-subunit alcohol dehydrogenase family)